MRKCLPYLYFLLLLAVYLYPFMRIFWGSGDEGTVIYGAVRVTEGQVPLRDFFEVIGPGSFYWLAFFFKLFGTSILTTRISVALTSVSTALLMYFLARRLKTGYDAVPAILLLATTFGGLWPAISHHNDSNLFALLAFMAIICWIDKHRPWMLCLAGALAGITTLFLQPKGILLFLAFVLLIFLFRGGTRLRSSLAWLTGSYLVIGLLLVLFYWKAGGLSGLIYANVLWPITNYSDLNSVPYAHGIRELYWEPWTAALGVFSPMLAFGITGLLSVPVLFVAALPAIGVLLAIFRRPVAFESSTLPYWIAGTALWISELHRRDIGHLAYGSPLLVIACLHYLVRGRHRTHLYALQLVCISSFALALFNGGIVLAAGAKVASRRGTFYALKSNPVLEFLDNRIKPGEEIFAYPYCPQYYFLSATRNPTRFSVLMYHYNANSDFRESVRSLEEKKVRYVIWDREFIYKAATWCWPAYALPRKGDLIVEPYLAEHYRLLRRINGIDILERRADLTGLRRASEPGPSPASSEARFKQSVYRSQP